MPSYLDTSHLGDFGEELQKRGLVVFKQETIFKLASELGSIYKEASEFEARSDYAVATRIKNHVIVCREIIGSGVNTSG